MVTINGAVAVVTGGQRGLGRAFVAELLDRGASKIYATARRPTPSDDPRVVPVTLDVTDPASVASLAELAGDASIVINNAGIGGAGPLLSSGIDEIREVFETNLFGAIRVAQAFAPILARNGGGASGRHPFRAVLDRRCRSLRRVQGRILVGDQLTAAGARRSGHHRWSAFTSAMPTPTSRRRSPRPSWTRRGGPRRRRRHRARGRPRCSSTTSAGTSSRRWPARSRDSSVPTAASAR